MELIVDLHVHSHYSRATSKDMNLKGLFQWGKLKGIAVLGTGDFTHPAWFDELSHQLVQQENGLYTLSKTQQEQYDADLPKWCRHHTIQFIPTVEISTIYSKAGAVRKIHQVIAAPTLEIAAQVNLALSKIGNLSADGRPILGIDSKELFKRVMSVHEDIIFFPAHVWTPWFGLFGSKSGFDSIVESYEEASDQIYALETGLSADPQITLQIPDSRARSIISHSDAHSPQKLGREATVYACQPEYHSILGAMKTNDDRLVGTIEFYPEEGKYYFDGHRKCNIFFTPQQTHQHQGICPVCGKKLTVGVLNRVMQLSRKKKIEPQKTAKETEYIIPLTQLLAHHQGVKNGTGKRVQETYFQMLQHCGDEFSILRKLPVVEIAKKGFEHEANLIQKMRDHQVVIKPGYDGVYGSIDVMQNDS